MNSKLHFYSFFFSNLLLFLYACSFGLLSTLLYWYMYIRANVCEYFFPEVPATNPFEWRKLIPCHSKDGKLHLKNLVTACLFQNKVVLALNNPDPTLNSFNFNHFIFSLLLFHSFWILALRVQIKDKHLHNITQNTTLSYVLSAQLVLWIEGKKLFALFDSYWKLGKRVNVSRRHRCQANVFV